MCGFKVEQEEVRGCTCKHPYRGCLIQGTEDLKIDNTKAISSLEKEGSYKFLGALKNVKQEDRIVLQNAAKVYYRGYHRVTESNQCACTNRCYQPKS